MEVNAFIYFIFFTDIDECDDQSICQDGKNCVNTRGSYACQDCINGTNFVDGKCVGKKILRTVIFQYSCKTMNVQPRKYRKVKIRLSNLEPGAYNIN